MNTIRKTISSFCLGLSFFADTPAISKTTVLENVNIVDGTSDHAKINNRIVIEDSRIISIGRSDPLPIDARRIDLAGRWVIPGMIDAHVHVSSIGAARNLVSAGVTTARSMLTMHFVDAGIQALHLKGMSELPEMLPAGYPIVPNPSNFIPDLGGMFLDSPNLADLYGRPLNDEGIRRVVRANIARGATYIKVFATDRAGVVDSDPRAPLLSEAQLRIAVDEARTGGARIAAHAHGDGGAAAAVRAGVDTIEHGTFLSDATLKLMRDADVCLVPTMEVATANIYPMPGIAAARTIRDRWMAPRSKAAVRNAMKIGVKVIAGTDSDYDSGNYLRIGDELGRLRELGMKPMDVLRAATSRSADCVGIGDRAGRISVGYEADIVVLERSPLEDINAVRDIYMVINDGVVAVDHSGTQRPIEQRAPDLSQSSSTHK